MVHGRLAPYYFEEEGTIMSTSGDSRDPPYDLLGNLQKLLIKIDVNDEALIVRRAIELQAFMVSLHYPCLSQLPTSRKVRPPALDMIALARRHAALKLYIDYIPPGTYRRSLNIKGLPSWRTFQTGLSTNFRCIEVLLDLLRDYLGIEGGGLSALERAISEKEYADKLKSQLVKAKAVATLIGAYRSNGANIPITDKRSVGLRKIKDALCILGLFDKSEKTLDMYFEELESTSVFHYLRFSKNCEEVLRIIDPSSPRFAQEIMQRARSTSSVDELRAVCLLYNTVASELNNKYGFAFVIIENVLKPEERTKYDSLSGDEYNDDIAEYFSK
jgi:hypothetical protein